MRFRGPLSLRPVRCDPDLFSWAAILRGRYRPGTPRSGQPPLSLLYPLDCPSLPRFHQLETHSLFPPLHRPPNTPYGLRSTSVRGGHYSLCVLLCLFVLLLLLVVSLVSLVSFQGGCPSYRPSFPLVSRLVTAHLVLLCLRLQRVAPTTAAVCCRATGATKSYLCAVEVRQVHNVDKSKNKGKRLKRDVRKAQELQACNDTRCAAPAFVPLCPPIPGQPQCVVPPGAP